MLFKAYLRSFLIYLGFFAGYVLVMLSARLLTTEHLVLSEDWGYVAVFGLLFTSVAGFVRPCRKMWSLFLLYIILYLAAALTKRWDGMILSEREIVHTLCLATFLYAFVAILMGAAEYIKSKILKAIGIVLYVVTLLMPMVMIFYFVLNKAVFSADIALTLFQTNSAEIIAYLQDQNCFLWLVASLAVIGLVGGLIYFFAGLKYDARFFKTVWVLSVAVFVWSGLKVFPKINVNFAYHISYHVYETLKTFALYEKSTNERLTQIEALRGQVSSAYQKGIFVLAIGESQTRDHMSAYGYDRQTTPWLDDIKKNQNVILFDQAYSNHTHTVPTLSYALSSQDQYHDKTSDQALSLIEIAKAAGFHVYWISNQPKDSIFVTPLTVMASLADKQIWLNGSVGDKMSTEYYDGKLVDVLQYLKPAEKSLIILHFMGSHGAYRDRYPAKFDVFKSQNKFVDAYDNSILYTDFVLQSIAETLEHNENFKALVYFSDHGDDADHKRGHESSRFTYEMSRIPLLIVASDELASEDHFKTLQAQKHVIFTNDLIYDLMLDLMQIKGVQKDEAYSLTGGHYILNRDNALTLHGQKALKDEN